MKKMLVSACLLGERVRYDGQSKSLKDHLLDRLVDEKRVIRYCPEVGGGLPVPRPAAEIRNGDGAAVIAGSAQVATEAGEEVTASFVAGAEQALALCRQHAIEVAVLTERSPSCGSSQIYDGRFERKLIDGSGVTTALLRQHGIAVFSQFELKDAMARLESAGA